MQHEPLRFRYASEATGLVVLLALILFVAAVMQAGVLHDLFRPSVVLRVILPRRVSPDSRAVPRSKSSAPGLAK